MNGGLEVKNDFQRDKEKPWYSKKVINFKNLINTYEQNKYKKD